MSINAEVTQIPLELPKPPFGEEVDLRRFASLPLDVQLLRDSEFVVFTSAEEFRAHLLLMCAAWHRVPAGSLPSDDLLLNVLAKVEKNTWKKIKNGALRGFILHSDKRFYHPVLTATVLKSWASMRVNTNRTLAATAAAIEKKRKERDGHHDVSHDDQRNENQLNRVEKKGDEKKGDELKEKEKEKETPPPRAGGGVFMNSNEIGLGDLLSGINGFTDQALLASLTKAAAGASHEQLDRAAAVIKDGASQVKNLTAWSIAIAKKAALGLVTSIDTSSDAPQPHLMWAGKDGWSIQTSDYGKLTVEFGMLKSDAGILHTVALHAVAAGLKTGEYTLLLPP